MLTKRAERCAVARRERDGGHAAQHLSNIEMASRRVAVGTLITERPPHRTVRAAFPHTAPTLGG